jgi:hypothetical protein
VLPPCSADEPNEDAIKLSSRTRFVRDASNDMSNNVCNTVKSTVPYGRSRDEHILTVFFITSFILAVMSRLPLGSGFSPEAVGLPADFRLTNYSKLKG